MVRLGGWFENVAPSTPHTFEVRAVVDGGEVSLGIGDLHVMLKGQAMNAQDSFDGLIPCVDTISPHLLGHLIASIDEDIVSLDTHIPMTVSLNDTVYDIYELGRMIVPLVETSAYLSPEQARYTRITEDEASVRVTEDGGIRLTEGNV